MNGQETTLCVIGDAHGHLQLALCMAARWQRELAVRFDAVLLCGDLGTFTADSQLDSTTRRHGKANPCELEFLYQWSADPQPLWLQRIFQPADDGGLGLACPVVMVHGNHEGFAHLERIVPQGFPDEIVNTCELPGVDTKGHIRYLPSGWITRSPSGLMIAGVGGIERGQRHADYHPMAYLDEAAVLRLLEERPPIDVLVTHQGPSDVQGERKGSKALQMLLDSEVAPRWFHGHSTPNMEIAQWGPNKATTVVPLGDIAFSGNGVAAEDPGRDGWSLASFGQTAEVAREQPVFWRDYRRTKWKQLPNGQLVCFDLARWA